MNKTIEALKLAKDWFDWHEYGEAGTYPPAQSFAVRAAIREALAERQDKPEECANGCPKNMVCDYCQGAEPVKQEPDFVGWYCAHCERGVDSSEVTFHEQHEVCGRVITNDVPPKHIKQEPVYFVHFTGDFWVETTKEKYDTARWNLRKKLYAAPVDAKAEQEISK